MRFSSSAILRALLLPVLVLSLGVTAGAQEKTGKSAKSKEDKPKVPEGLVGDEHVREEFGVNDFTTPSIRKVFDSLDALGTLPYDQLKRPISEKAPSDRVLLALGLGTLIGDGFLVVQCEKIEEMENVGRAILKYAKALGAGLRINKHSQSLLENSLKGDWDKLRAELASTQADVEGEMVQLRDSDVAHLIALGGWLRAFEIATEAVAANYSEDKSRALGRSDVVEYFLNSLESLHPDIQAQPAIQTLHDGLEAMIPILDVPEGKAFTLDEVKDLKEKAHLLAGVVQQELPKK
ncbi:hypothetical protein DES53_11713 [Roseimicrobium gellanilyticum]|uniref:Uncharacterized protein n=1 Tax=Roseimicrobium gellanilyticum TaxID=748857 RepID=A0A366H5Y6_9BACT|nr:hypothetical protein [Roseimicrobium gellanilyticum]RBP36324.1 hypothetical protein DES53_11713 [Roseimicrobium gellanilyticum]